jgi:hypothetical protein
MGEGVLGLILSGDIFMKHGWGALGVFLALSLVMIIRLKYGEHVSTPMWFFLGIYLSQNFVVNSLDWMLFKKGEEV